MLFNIICCSVYMKIIPTLKTDCEVSCVVRDERKYIHCAKMHYEVQSHVERFPSTNQPYDIRSKSVLSCSVGKRHN